MEARNLSSDNKIHAALRQNIQNVSIDISTMSNPELIGMIEVFARNSNPETFRVVKLYVDRVLDNQDKKENYYKMLYALQFNNSKSLEYALENIPPSFVNHEELNALDFIPETYPENSDERAKLTRKLIAKKCEVKPSIVIISTLRDDKQTLSALNKDEKEAAECLTKNFSELMFDIFSFHNNQNQSMRYKISNPAKVIDTLLKAGAKPDSESLRYALICRRTPQNPTISYAKKLLDADAPVGNLLAGFDLSTDTNPESKENIEFRELYFEKSRKFFTTLYHHKIKPFVDDLKNEKYCGKERSICEYLFSRSAYKEQCTWSGMHMYSKIIDNIFKKQLEYFSEIEKLPLKQKLKALQNIPENSYHERQVFFTYDFVSLFKSVESQELLSRFINDDNSALKLIAEFHSSKNGERKNKILHELEYAFRDGLEKFEMYQMPQLAADEKRHPVRDFRV